MGDWRYSSMRPYLWHWG